MQEEQRGYGGVGAPSQALWYPPPKEPLWKLNTVLYHPPALLAATSCHVLWWYEPDKKTGGPRFPVQTCCIGPQMYLRAFAVSEQSLENLSLCRGLVLNKASIRCEIGSKPLEQIKTLKCTLTSKIRCLIKITNKIPINIIIFIFNIWDW